MIAGAEQASTYAASVDGLIWLIAALVGFWFLVAELALFGLILRFRRREGQKALYLDGSNARHKRWITIPHALVLVCDVVIIVGAIRVWNQIKQDLPPADQKIRVVGQQWAWSFQHPGPDGKLDTSDDRWTVDELHVQAGVTYHFLLSSKDVIHSFAIPAFRLKQDAVPGRWITGWFEATHSGRFDIQCTEICGVGHGAMRAQIHVETPEQHAAWNRTAAHAQRAAGPARMQVADTRSGASGSADHGEVP